ncbi:hypothetical protein RS81_03136 [Microbacterium terrae]|uniref:YchJ-like middle NTF2-like domain-containing protein n=2 Tax=Microbacterium terrae TaxID=69369 RepID=A0A0M2H234_9MICO|nr:hypothetical protein RS81_03136 [Microbacterium terrae]
MRSRYCAFAIGDARYLADTWHPRTRPSELTIDAALRWTGLRIVDTVRGAAGDADGIVEFRARWSGLGERGELHERSRFVHQRHRWWYVDGDVAD